MHPSYRSPCVLLSGSAIGGDRIAVVFGQRLADVVDPAVFVAIDDDDAVFPADPAGLFQPAVAAVQVQHQCVGRQGDARQRPQRFRGPYVGLRRQERIG